MLTPWPENLGGSSRRSWRRGGRRRRGASCWPGGRRTRKPSGSQPDPCPALARPFTRIPIFFFLTSPVFTLIFSHLSFPSYTSPHGYFLLWQFVFMLVSYFVVLVVLCLSSCFLTFICRSFLPPLTADERLPSLFCRFPAPSVFPQQENYKQGLFLHNGARKGWKTFGNWEESRRWQRTIWSWGTCTSGQASIF